eukprot:193302-Pleurochrysis_carterae.AAC.5
MCRLPREESDVLYSACTGGLYCLTFSHPDDGVAQICLPYSACSGRISSSSNSKAVPTRITTIVYLIEMTLSSIKRLADCRWRCLEANLGVAPFGLAAGILARIWLQPS